MKVELDLISCRNNGECVISAPQVFSLDENGIQSLRIGAPNSSVIIEVSDQYIQAVEETVIVCPMQAISIIDVN
jgi:ferredoxin